MRVSRIGNNADSIRPRLASALAMSWLATSSGRATWASMPRAISRSAPTCPLYVANAACRRAVGTSAARRVLSLITSTSAGLPSAQSLPKSGLMRSATSMSCERMASARSFGAAAAFRPWAARKRTRFGACSAPMVGICSGCSICVRTRLSDSLPMPRISSGYSSGPNSRVSASVRRSRDRSRSSLRITVIRVDIMLMRAGPLRCRSVSRTHPPGWIRRTARAVHRRCRRPSPCPWR